MEKAVIYGCGKIGKFVYDFFKDQYEILFFVDKNANEIKEWGGVIVREPAVLTQYWDVTVIVASVWHKEMIEYMEHLGILNRNVLVFKMELASIHSERKLPKEIEAALDKRTINLGEWLHRQKQLTLKELTFIAGGSGVMDYLFLKQTALVSGCREYFEIGTYIGESINILTDCCEKLYSVSLPKDELKNYFIQAKNPNYVGRLSKNGNIVHYDMDSRLFDFSKHADTVGLYFIDGDHSYQGVYHDTKNIFEKKRDDAIVVWHDFKKGQNAYHAEVIKAVYDVLGEKFEQVYVTDNNLCGIYIPQNRMDEFGFVVYERKYEENAPLYTYNLALDSGVRITG